MTHRKILVTVAALLSLCAFVMAQQVADTDYRPPIERPAYGQGKGPLVLIDEAHFNFHTASGRYLPFAELLRRDGFVVKGSAAKFSRDSLREAKILVIANALNERNGKGDWSLPTPSAFTDDEVAAVREWVQSGGALLLIVDHMPFPGAADKLASAFGIRFSNGFARSDKTQGGPDIFRRADGSLADHPITNGSVAAEKIDTVASFTGSAFRVEGAARPLMTLSDSFVSLEPEVAWQFTEQTKRVPLKGWLQGATLNAGKGRVAVFGEAAMFSAQLAGPQRQPMGMNAPAAKQNHQFLLNVMHWLAGRPDDHLPQH
ncbi:MAG: DUF4350 domain-containing protein [Blastocatellia bacterium]